MPPKPKIAVQCAVPPEFADYMQEVSDQIARGEKQAISIVSDDLLQSSKIPCYGGLFDVAEKRYGFWFRLSDGSTWLLQLQGEEISSIASRKVTDISMWRCDSENCSTRFATASSYCSKCDSIRHFENYAVRLRRNCPELSDAEVVQGVSLRAIAIAILDFHRKHGHFPPVQTIADDGTPLHSWRSLILPFLDEVDLYNRIRFDEPWDSSRNAQLWTCRPTVFASEMISPFSTQMVSVVDNATIWPAGGTSKISEIDSGTSYTISVIATRNLPRIWMEPRDITRREAISEYRERGSILAAFVDGSVRAMRDISEAEFDALLRKDAIAKG
jgi:hypothetical protein